MSKKINLIASPHLTKAYDGSLDEAIAKTVAGVNLPFPTRLIAAAGAAISSKLDALGRPLRPQCAHAAEIGRASPDNASRLQVLVGPEGEPTDRSLRPLSISATQTGQTDMSEISERCRGRWTSVLQQAGIPSRFLTRKDGPCPMCSGTDRYRYSDNGYGRWYCRGCQTGGDGVHLLMAYKGISLAAALTLIESIVGGPVRSVYKEDDRPKRDPLKPWRDASPLLGAGTVQTYLKARAIDLTEVEALSLRFHPALWHWPTASRWPAMVGCVKRHDGTEITSHQTFLDLDGRSKAPIERNRLFPAGATPEGGIWFGVANPERELIVAEGIESCLSAMRLYHLSAGVAALSESGIRRLVLPEAARRVRIFADRDELGQGLAAAHEARRRWKDEGRVVAISQANLIGEDANDVWLRRVGP
jgi:putative DNA primase/helicase